MSSDRGVRLRASPQGGEPGLSCLPRRLHCLLRRRTLLLALALLASGCGSMGTKGASAERARWNRVYVVERGDTAWAIARRYGTTVDALARANRLRDPSRLSIGQRLRVPNGSKPRGAPSSSYRAGSPALTAAMRPEVLPDPAPRPPGRLIWPVRGPIRSRFGMRWGAHHDGIDIAAPSGTPVRAAASGRVVHSDNSLAGYGNLIILQHSGGRSTVYAHNKVNLVRRGQSVARGQVIAYVGSTGRATGPHLHFEVRRDGMPSDPLQSLP